MIIVALTAQGASFFHVRAAYPRSAQTVKSSKPSHSQKDARRHLRLPGRFAVPPERAAEICRQKSILACSLLQAILRLDSNEGR